MISIKYWHRVLLIFIMAFTLSLVGVRSLLAANPYLPLYEHVPDGEPRIFGDRLYIYGSHDTSNNTGYCGNDYVVWSAPLNDLNSWTYHGVIFEAKGTLWAPDVVQGPDGRYYLYAFGPGCNEYGSMVIVCDSDKPTGPFKFLHTTDIAFDPAVLVDDDGRVYAYGNDTGNMKGTPVKAEVRELNPRNMWETIAVNECTMKDGSSMHRLYEALSIRKSESGMNGKYILVYSATQLKSEGYVSARSPDIEYRGCLSYSYSYSPVGPWTYGGIIIDNGGEFLKDGSRTYRDGNNHGGIIKANGQWYIFYHRMSNDSEYSRQDMVEPIDLTTINGAVSIKQVEMTSQGFESNGLNAYSRMPAGVTCYTTPVANGPYVTTAYKKDTEYNPVVRIRNGSVVGYKYVNFGNGAPTGKSMSLILEVMPKGTAGSIDVVLDDPVYGEAIGSFKLGHETSSKFEKLTIDVKSVKGKHAVFFRFSSEDRNEICEFNFFKFTIR